MSSNESERAGFLGRWSERKRTAEAEQGTSLPLPDVAETALPEAVAPEVSDSAAAVVEETPLLSDEDMPPIESLNASSDLTDFFNRGVSAALRRAALRHVFQSPVYNVRDGLNDYDGDYTQFEPLGDTITSDMKFHAARKERERLEREAELEAERVARADEPTGEDSEEPLEEVAAADEEEPAVAEEPIEQATTDDDTEAPSEDVADNENLLA